MCTSSNGFAFFAVLQSHKKVDYEWRVGIIMEVNLVIGSGPFSAALVDYVRVYGPYARLHFIKNWVHREEEAYVEHWNRPGEFQGFMSGMHNVECFSLNGDYILQSVIAMVWISPGETSDWFGLYTDVRVFISNLVTQMPLCVRRTLTLWTRIHQFISKVIVRRC